MSSEVFKLDKHMQALTIQPGFDGVLVLRPRYETTPEKAQRLYKGLMEWKKSTGSKAQFLIIPHDIDVFAFAKETQPEQSPPGKAGRENP